MVGKSNQYRIIAGADAIISFVNVADANHNKMKQIMQHFVRSARPHATELLATLTKEGTMISLITFGDISEGIYYGRDPQQAQEVFARFLRSVDILPLTGAIMQQFAQIRGELRRSGNLIGDFDLLIAATAIHHHLTLVTRNRKDYQRIPHLKLYNEG